MIGENRSSFEITQNFQKILESDGKYKCEGGGSNDLEFVTLKCTHIVNCSFIPTKKPVHLSLCVRLCVCLNVCVSEGCASVCVYA